MALSIGTLHRFVPHVYLWGTSSWFYPYRTIFGIWLEWIDQISKILSAMSSGPLADFFLIIQRTKNLPPSLKFVRISVIRTPPKKLEIAIRAAPRLRRGFGGQASRR